jgi:ribosomal protein L13
MLPNGYTKKHLRKRLKIYQGNQHPHTAQNLIEMEIENRKINKKIRTEIKNK